ncbi:hypothetical protein ZWY2020_024279 [Hordeum vulgare]|nr:hypothetical protein ZWY2020_024279 [Hordeum vulgare]
MHLSPSPLEQRSRVQQARPRLTGDVLRLLHRAATAVRGAVGSAFVVGGGVPLLPRPSAAVQDATGGKGHNARCGGGETAEACSCGAGVRQCQDRYGVEGTCVKAARSSNFGRAAAWASLLSSCSLMPTPPSSRCWKCTSPSHALNPLPRESHLRAIWMMHMNRMALPSPLH